MSGDADEAGVGDIADGIGATRILCKASIIEIEFARCLIDHDVLKDRAEAFRCGENFGFGFRRKADHLGIATALEIEDAAIGPTVLVVADQRAVRIGRQCCLAGARQSEEDRAFL